MIYTPGIYENYETGYRVKVLKRYKVGKYKLYTLYFLNNKDYGKSHFTLPWKTMRSFMKGYRKIK